MPILRKLYRWCSATRLRKTLSLILIFLIILNAVRFIIISPKIVKAADTVFGFDEGYGTTTQDKNQSVSSLTINGASWKTGDLCRRDKCLYFDGNDSVTIADANTDGILDFTNSEGFTFMGWFRHGSTFGATVQDMINKINPDDNDGGWRLQWETNGTISIKIDDNDADTTIDDTLTSSLSYADNKWHHVAAVKNGTTSLKLYVDGVEVGTMIPTTTTTLSNDDAFTLGIRDTPTPTTYYTGFMDEIKIYGSARTAAQIKSDYLGPTSPDMQSPVAYWKMDESVSGNAQTIYDISGNSHSGTTNDGANNTGMDCTVAGQYGGGCSFDAVDDYINVSTFTDLSNSTYTVSMWIYKADDVSETIFNARVSGSTDERIYFNIATLGRVQVIDDYGVSYTSPNNTLTLNTWQHVAYTYDYPNQNVSLYVNGTYVGGDTSFTQAPPVLSTAYIGYRPSTTFNGQIDEVKIYNYARSPGQILEDMNQTVSGAPGVSASFGPDLSYLSNGLVGYWKMDESSWTTDCSTDAALDSSGNANHAHACPATTGLSAGAVGKFGNGAAFDFSDDYLTAPSSTSLSLTNAFTISAWVKPNGASNDYARFVEKGYASGGYHFGVGADAGRDLSVWLNGTSIADTGEVLTDNKWQLATATFDGNSVKIYLNGSEVASGSFTGPLAGNGSAVRIGAGSGGQRFNGSLDEVRVFNRALSSGEVKDLYNWAPYPVGHWKFDEGTGSNAYDISGNNLVATKTNANWSAGKIGGAFETKNAEGLQDHFDVAHNAVVDFTNTQDFTLSAWVKLGTIENGTAELVMKAGGTPTVGYYLYATSAFKCSYRNDAVLDTASDPDTNDGNWHFVSCVMDRSGTATGTAGLHIFVDGILKASDTSLTAGSGSNTTGIIIGEHSTSYEYNSQIDEVKIYNYPRNQSQIIEDMNGGHPTPGSPVGSATAYWKFDEGYGTTVNDSSINALNLTQSSSSWTNSGKYGKAWNGNGANWMSITDAASLDKFDFAATDDFSISMWVKSDSATNPAGSEYILSKAEASAGYRMYVDNGSTGIIYFGIDDDATWTPGDYVNTVSDVYDLSWHHIVVVKQGTTKIQMYVDGILTQEDTSLIETGTLANSIALYLGDRNGVDGGDEFNGDIDEIRIYRLALSGDQVKVEHNRGSAAVMGAVSTSSSGVASWSSDRSYCPPGNTDTNCSGSSNPAPVGEWNLDENTGTTANDTSGNANTGTLSGSGTPSWSSGKHGAGLLFNGSTSYVNAGNATPLEITGNLSISSWIKLGSGTGVQDIVSRNGSSGSYNYRLYITSGKNLAMEVSNNGTAVTTLSGTTALSSGIWYHVEGVYVPSTSMTIYINGIQEAQSTTSIPASINNAATVDLNIGSENNGVGVAGGAFVQECPDSANPTTGFELVITCATTGGNLLVLNFQVNTGSSNNYSVADTGGNTWTRIYDHRPVGVVNTGQVWYSKTTSNNTTVTITNTTSQNQGMAVSLMEFSGIQASPLDKSSGNADDVGSTSMTSNATATTAQAHEVAVGHLGVSNNGNITGSGTGFTYMNKVDNTANVAVRSGYRILTSTGTVENTGTAGTSDDWNAYVATFKSNTPVTANFFSGYIDNVRIYNYARSPAQVAWDYNYGKPLAWYKMDENLWNTTANEVKDSSGNTLHGTAAGNATTTTGKYNNGGTFDGTGDYFSVADTAALDLTGDFSLTAWFSRAGGVNGYLITKTNGSDGGYALLHGQNGEIYCRTSNGSTFTDSYTNTGIVNADSVWHHLAVTRSGTSCRVYIDGVDRTTTAATHTTLTANSNAVRVGSAPDGTSQVNGKIDDARIYNYALSPQQVKEIMNYGAVNYKN